LPPLRERRSDIPLLAQSFMSESARANGKSVRQISREAMDVLMNYSWPAMSAN